MDDNKLSLICFGISMLLVLALAAIGLMNSL